MLPCSEDGLDTEIKDEQRGFRRKNQKNNWSGWRDDTQIHLSVCTLLMREDDMFAKRNDTKRFESAKII